MTIANWTDEARSAWRSSKAAEDGRTPSFFAKPSEESKRGRVVESATREPALHPVRQIVEMRGCEQKETKQTKNGSPEGIETKTA